MLQIRTQLTEDGRAALIQSARIKCYRTTKSARVRAPYA